MNNELKVMLESVLQEALQPIKDDNQSLKEDVLVLKTEFQTLKSDVQTLNSDIQSLQDGQSELYQLTRSIYDRQDETDARLKALTMDVHHAIGYITSLKQIQARQEKIMGTLALRTLEQEADLHELKYAYKRPQSHRAVGPFLYDFEK